MNYLASIGWHGINILTFRHQGKGLENCSKQNCITLALISIMVNALVIISEGASAVDFLVMMTIHVLYLYLVVKWFGLVRASGISCFFITFGAIKVINATILASSVGPNNSVFLYWELAALMWFIIQTRKD